MSLSGWRAWLQALRYLPHHLSYRRIEFSARGGATAQDTELLQEVLSTLLNRGFFPTIQDLYLETETSRADLVGMLLALVPRSNISALRLRTPDDIYDDALTLALEGTLASGRLRLFGCSVTDPALRAVKATASMGLRWPIFSSSSPAASRTRRCWGSLCKR